MSDSKMGPAIRCARCGLPAPISDEELTGDGGGDAELLVLLIPPSGWVDDSDGDGIVHLDCASRDERDEWFGVPPEDDEL